MQVLDRFAEFVAENSLCKPTDTILLAVSGGKDSMLMATLFLRAGYRCMVAHCNFQLRGHEADADEALVRDFARQHELPFYVQHFQTQDYASQHKISIQMAARELRYEWFADLQGRLGASVLAVAQHQNDHVETMLLNLSRGTGLQGLVGILPKRGTIIRPILFLQSAEIAALVEAWDVPYRDDASNFSTKYARNKIRIDIIPQFEQLQPDFVRVMSENATRFQQARRLLDTFVDPIRASLFIDKQGTVELAKAALAPFLMQADLLYELFRPYGFTASVLRDLAQSWQQEPGRLFESPTHQLLLDRQHLLLRPKVSAASSETEVFISAGDATVDFAQQRWSLEVSAAAAPAAHPDTAMVDLQQLIFPLSVRYWQQGDLFYPLGMKGRKKLSDFFINQKVNTFDKKNIPILVNGNGDIIWVMGYRLDNRYRITEHTTAVLTIKRY